MNSKLTAAFFVVGLHQNRKWFQKNSDQERRCKTKNLSAMQQCFSTTAVASGAKIKDKDLTPGLSYWSDIHFLKPLECVL